MHVMTPMGPGKPRRRVWVCDKCGEGGVEKVNIAVRGKDHEASLCSVGCAHAYLGAILAMASLGDGRSRTA